MKVMEKTVLVKYAKVPGTDETPGEVLVKKTDGLPHAIPPAPAGRNRLKGNVVAVLTSCR